MKEFFISKGAIVPSPDIPCEVGNIVQNFEIDAAMLYSYLQRMEFNIGIIKEVKVAKEKEAVEKLPQIVKTLMVTNGWSMLRNMKNLISEAKELFEAGIFTILVSTDKSHQEAAVRAGIKLDYEILKGYASAISNNKLHPAAKLIKQKLGDKYFRLSESWNGGFIIPIGNARNLSWNERIKLSEIRNLDYKTITELLEKEHDNWKSVKSYAHPQYCDVAYFFRDNSRAYHFKLENRLHLWKAQVDPDLNVHLCSSKILPSVGSLKEFGFNDLYSLALNNPLYKTIAYEGPQGVARKLGWKEEDIKARFIERTPCGLCEDIKFSGGFEKLSN
jgi:hypothetical protein